MAVELLCAADFHLGRRTRRLPEGIDASTCSPAAAFQRLVAVALQRRPDAVLLAGDIVDRDNAFFEAFGPLEAGVRELVEAGIQVLAVAGNHDHQVLARLADRIPEFVLLGRGGKWEDHALQVNGEVRARIRGWSFPRWHVKENPLAAYPRPEPGPTVVGLLHCDVDVGDSPYGPVPRAELEAAGAAAWVLGHVHTPRVLRGSEPLLLYCGSPQGLDPSEIGAHGAWWLRIDDAGIPELEQIPLAGLRWEAVEVELDGVGDQERFDAAVLEALRGVRAGLDHVPDDGPVPIGCRLTLSGRTAAHDRLGAWSEALHELRMPADGAAGELFVDRVYDEAAPAFDLGQLARAGDPPGHLARRLVVLESGEPRQEYERLLRVARDRLDSRASLGTYLGLGDPIRFDDAALRDQLRRAGLRLLEAMLGQTQEARP